MSEIKTSTTSTEFNKSQFDDLYPLGIEHHFWQIARNYILYRLLKKIDCNTSKILEIGCGRGVVVQSLRKRNINAWGVELGESNPFSECKPFIKTGLFAEDLEEKERLSYDTLLLLDVIEHIENTNVFLSSLIKHFPNAKKIIIFVPARTELWSQHDDFNHHYRRYNRPMLKTLAKELNVSLSHSHYFFRLLYIPILILKHTSKNNTISTFTKRFLHKCIALLCILDFYFLPGFVAGSSLMTVFTLNRKTHL